MKTVRPSMIALAAVLLISFLIVFPVDAADKEIVATGKTGDITWTIYSNKTLVFSGNGKMADHQAYSTPQWFSSYGSHFTTIEHIIIQEGITYIGSYSFPNYAFQQKIKSVTIPTSVTSMGQFAFHLPSVEAVYISDLKKWCDIEYQYNQPGASPLSNGAALYLNGVRIETLTFPSNIKEIGTAAFYGCGGIERVVIPKTIRSIGSFAFNSCPDLRAIYFEGDAPKLGSNLFTLTNVIAFYPENNSTWNEDVFSKQDSHVIWVPYRDVPTGWKQMNGNWYYFENGIYVVDWKQIDGKWYYFTDEGKMLTGWRKIDGNWYYLNSEMKTGWQKIDGKWYYLNSEMKTGWQNVDGKWYYLDNEMKTGWQKIDGKWYYLNSEMKTGWQKIDGKWYYLNSEMKTGWQKIDGNWYYLNSEMKTGWLKNGGKWYYLGTDGIMQTGTHTIDGKVYVFGTDGAMIP